LTLAQRGGEDRPAVSADHHTAGTALTVGVDVKEEKQFSLASVCFVAVGISIHLQPVGQSHLHP
jgi:hypothetical protein